MQTVTLTNDPDVWPGGGDDNSQNDTVFGLGGDDRIDGGGYNPGAAPDDGDYLFGGLGADTIVIFGGEAHGDEGNDILSGSSFAELYGGAGSDLLFSNGTMYGGEDDDTLTLIDSSFGVLDGGAGTDTLSLMSNTGTLSFINGPTTIAGVEILDTNGVTLESQPEDLAGFSLIRFNAGNANDPVSLSLWDAPGESGSIDLSAALDAGGGRAVDLLIDTFGETYVTLGSGNDTVNASGAGGGVNAGAGNDLIVSTLDFNINGDAGNDTIDIQGRTISPPDPGNGIMSADGGLGTDLILLEGSLGVGSTIEGGDGTDELFIVYYFMFDPIPHTYLDMVALSGLEVLNVATNAAVMATAGQFEAFDTIRVDATNPTASVILHLRGTGLATSLDLSDELSSGGGLRGATVIGSADNETIVGGNGNDTIDGGFGGDVVHGGGGNDILIDELGGDDALFGEDGNDAITDSLGVVVAINGGAGNDIVTIRGISPFSNGLIEGGSGSDTLAFTAGGGAQHLDQLTVSGFETLHTAGNEIVSTGAGFEAFTIIRVNAANPAGSVLLRLRDTGAPQTAHLAAELNAGGGPRGATIEGSVEGDKITSGGGADTLRGYTGADTLDGGGGNDTLDAGTGAADTNDTASYASAAAGVTVSLAIAGAQNTVGAGVDTIVRFENLLGSAHADTLTGNDGANRINGSGGNDALHGGIGDDRLVGGTGDDTLDGGAGVDTADYSSAPGGVIVDLSLNGPQAVGSGLGSDTLNLVENLIGGVGQDTLMGDSAANTLDGGKGQDTLRGSVGADIYIVDNPLDVVIENAGEGSDEVRSSVTFSIGDTVEILTLTGASNINGTGGNNANVLNGNARINNLLGMGGNDTINGGVGNDQLDGGSGNDDLFGGDGIDLFTSSAGADDYNGGAGVDIVDFDSGGATVFLDGSGVNGGAAFGDTFALVENILGSDTHADFLTGDGVANMLQGMSGNDRLAGKGGADKLIGGAGSDELTGGTGIDVLTGGSGTDTIIFDAMPNALDRDTLADFHVGNDTLRIDASAFRGDLVAGGPVQLVANANPSSAGFDGGVFLYDTDNGRLSWDIIGDGGPSMLVAILTGAPALAASDFTVVA